MHLNPFHEYAADSDQALNVLFPHHLGHYVGLDVHDCPGYSRGYDLKAGQCITIEPFVPSPFVRSSETS